MLPFRLARLGLLLAAIGLNFAPALIGHAMAAPAPEAVKPDTVRPEIFKLADPAAMKDLMAAKNYPEVQSRIDQASKLPNLTPYETFVLNRLRISLASATGNSAMAMTALEAVIESGRLPAADRGDFIEALATYHFNAKDYPKAIVWFMRYELDTGDMSRVRSHLIRSYYLNDDFAKAKQELLANLQADVKAGRKPALEDLQLLANSANKTKDKENYLFALENLVQHYPSDDFWTDLLSRLQGKPGYATQLQLDVFRLESAAVKKMAVQEYVEMAELALPNFPAEAKKTVDAGFAAGVLGTGANAARHKKLRDQASKGAADDLKNIAGGEASAAKSKDGTGLVNLGYALVTMEQFDKGIELIQKGIAKGGLKRPEDAKLHLGVAYAMAGRKDDAIKTFDTVKGSDGVGDLARYWTYHVNRPVAAQ